MRVQKYDFGSMQVHSEKYKTIIWDLLLVISWRKSRLVTCKCKKIHKGSSHLHLTCLVLYYKYIGFWQQKKSGIFLAVCTV